LGQGRPDTPQGGRRPSPSRCPRPEGPARDMQRLLDVLTQLPPCSI